MIANRKPQKPYADFPLYSHTSGKWAKKIGGKMRYFGRWEDPEGALAEYQKFLQENLGEVTLSTGRLKLSDACNLFLRSKKDAVDQDKLSHRSYVEYRSTCKFFIDFFGRDFNVSTIQPLDLADYQRERSKVRNGVSMGNEITRIKTLFSWLERSELISDVPKYPAEFRKASKKEMRAHKIKTGSKKIEKDEVHRLLNESGIQMRAMILLGINCGYSPSDLASFRHTDWLGGELIEYHRKKTLIYRKAVLMPETIEALEAWKLVRPQPRNDESKNHFFLRADGVHFDEDYCEVIKRFSQIAKWANVKHTYYHLRHTFQNVAEKGGDSIAVKIAMGHADPSISDVYREGIETDRVRKLTDLVRKWLYG